MIYSWGRLLQEHSLPSLPSLLEVAPCKPSSWKHSIKLVLRTKALDQFFLQCSSLPIAGCDGRRFLAGKSLQHLNVTKGDRQLTRSSNFRIRLLVGCHGLEADACRFRVRNRSTQPGDPSCKLCGVEQESSEHFLLQCSALTDI